MLVARQKYACRDKHVNICLDESFVGTKIFCRDKRLCYRDKHVFVATKMILVAAPANDNFLWMSMATLVIVSIERD